jgi:hypothetical protein
VTLRDNRGFSRKSERGTAVVVVVMVTTLISAIGVFAVRSVSQIDQAAGYSRQATQTGALAELGTTAVVAQFGTGAAANYVDQMRKQPETCLANSVLNDNGGTPPCYKLFKADLETTIGAATSGEKLLKATIAGSDTGSFGYSSPLSGDVFTEITDPGPTGRPVAGTDLGGTGASFQYVKVTLTTTAQVRPVGDDLCNAGVASVTSRQTMRARVVVGPVASGAK